MNMYKPVIVVGHKNPDTDSIAAAICYADLKNKTENIEYAAKRAGHLNEETQFVLDYFGVKVPEYIGNVLTQVKDIEIMEVPGISKGMSIKKSWEYLRKNDIHSTAVVNGQKLIGLLSVGDIAKSYMDIHENTVLSEAGTPYANIVDTLDGQLLTGSGSGYFDKGKVLISAAVPYIMEQHIEEGDMVILGNRIEDQIGAIDAKAGCLIICGGAEASASVKEVAELKGCTIIQTPYDPYTAARLINQSINVGFFMRSEDLATFTPEDTLEHVNDVLSKKKFRNFPVVDDEGNYLGMMSRRDLLRASKKKVIIVDHNEKAQAVDGIEEASILEIIDHHRLGNIETIVPVFFRNQPVGSTCTIIYQMYKEKGLVPDKKHAGLLCAAILSDTLIYKSPTCTPVDVESAKELAAIAEIDDEAFARDMFRAGSSLGTKDIKEIIFQDYKKFNVNDTDFSIGQVSLMTEDEISELRPRVMKYLESVPEDEIIFFMMTSIMSESSEVVCSNRRACELLESAFNTKVNDGSAWLKGVVSRKKQLVPYIIEALQQ